MQTLNNLIKAAITVLIVILGVVAMYGLIHLFNEVLYQILVHPSRTMGVLIGIICVYGIYYSVNKYTGKTNL